MTQIGQLPAHVASLPAARTAAHAPPPERLPPPAAAEASPRAGHDHHRPDDRRRPAGPPAGSETRPVPAVAAGGEKDGRERPPRIESDTLLGPPPAFQASILDLESDLRAKLAQFAASRGQEEARALFHPGQRRESGGMPALTERERVETMDSPPASGEGPQPVLTNEMRVELQAADKQSYITARHERNRRLGETPVPGGSG